jgi:hypothetical protein
VRRPAAIRCGPVRAKKGPAKCHGSDSLLSKKPLDRRRRPISQSALQRTAASGRSADTQPVSARRFLQRPI